MPISHRSQRWAGAADLNGLCNGLGQATTQGDMSERLVLDKGPCRSTGILCSPPNLLEMAALPPQTYLSLAKGSFVPQFHRLLLSLALLGPLHLGASSNPPSIVANATRA